MITDHKHDENCNHDHQASTDQEAMQNVLAEMQQKLNAAPTAEELKDIRRKARNKRKKARQDARAMAHSRGEREAVEVGASVSQLLVQRKLRTMEVVRSRTTRRERAKMQRKNFTKIQNLGKPILKGRARGMTNDAIVIDEVQTG